jgi:hypothetical protein
LQHEGGPPIVQVPTLAAVLSLVIAGLDPAIHADAHFAWTTGSSPVVTTSHPERPLPELPKSAAARL